MKSKLNSRMTAEERIAYRKKRRLMRKVQVYSELALILFVIILIAYLLFSHFTKDDNTVAEESVATPSTEEEFVGLTPSAALNNVTEPKEKLAEEDAEPTSPSYSASSTDDTLSISGVDSSYGILINTDTNEIVASLNATDKIVPASMTKVLTVLVAANNISKEQLDEKVTISGEAVDYCYASGCATSGFVEGETVTVRDLFYGTILPSGGDAAAQLAMYVSGDIDSFVELMNDELKTLGLSETSHFTNPVGYYEENHYSTVYDIAMIMEAALDNDICREVLNAKVYQSSSTNFNAEGITISNWFLRRIEDKDIGGSIGGAKTGYVNESGSCAVSSETSESGTNYICVTAKASSSWQCIYDHVTIYSTYAK